MTGEFLVGDFGGVYAVLFAAHQVSDHWVQTHHQAITKGEKGWTGRLACLRHVATYTAVSYVAVHALLHFAGADVPEWRILAGMAVSAISHYIADRRTPLHRMARRLGKDEEWLARGGGYYAMDQSWHYAWLVPTALIIVT